MDYVTIKGYIKDGHLRVDLPENVADGEVTVQIPIQTDVPWDERPWTEAELADLLTVEPVPLGMLFDLGLPGAGTQDWIDIEDSAEYVERLRRAERERRNIWMDC